MKRVVASLIIGYRRMPTASLDWGGARRGSISELTYAKDFA